MNSAVQLALYAVSGAVVLMGIVALIFAVTGSSMADHGLNLPIIAIVGALIGWRIGRSRAKRKAA